MKSPKANYSYKYSFRTRVIKTTDPREIKLTFFSSGHIFDVVTIPNRNRGPVIPEQRIEQQMKLIKCYRVLATMKPPLNYSYNTKHAPLNSFQDSKQENKLLWNLQSLLQIQSKVNITRAIHFDNLYLVLDFKA